MQDSGRAILRVMPDPLGYYICTSDPVDKALIEEVEKRNPGRGKLEVLKRLVRTSGSSSQDTCT